ncbi:MAG: DUF4912 domain-containing protein [Thermodesulfobacteriota bacterium]|nr:DUF4912 domain-containing protein [Thermodesulfobacteriota bacterium]
MKPGSLHQLNQQLDEPRDLPDSYGETRVVLLPVEPGRDYVYWEVTENDFEQTKSGLPDGHGQTETILRFTDSDNKSFDVTVVPEAKSCYVDHPTPGQFYVAELGLKTADSGFLPISQSNEEETLKAAPVPRSEPESPVLQSITGKDIKDTPAHRDFVQMGLQTDVSEIQFHLDPENILPDNMKTETQEPESRKNRGYDINSSHVGPEKGLDFLKRMVELYNIHQDVPALLETGAGAADSLDLIKMMEIKYKYPEKIIQPDLVEMCEAGFMSGVSSIVMVEHQREFKHDKEKK